MTHRLHRFSRRAFCQSTLAAAVGAWTCSGTIQAAEPFRLRYVLASSMFGKATLAEVAAAANRLKMPLLDLWPMPHADQRNQLDEMGIDAFRELMAKQKVGLAMTSRYDLGPFALADELRLLRDLGGGLVITGSRGPKNVSGAEARQAVAEFIEKMKPQVAVAEQCGVTIGVENHANALIATEDSIRYLAELSPSPRLGVALAPYHLPQDPQVIAGLINDLGPKLVHWYAWQHGTGSQQAQPKEEELKQMPGRGPLDFAPILAALQKTGYTGLTEIFMHSYPRGTAILPVADDVADEIDRARRYLEKLLPV
ncbi:MAG: sugar phosphate isomerase/epimerase family protein [Planctomycetota bacterium]